MLAIPLNIACGIAFGTYILGLMMGIWVWRPTRLKLQVAPPSVPRPIESVTVDMPDINVQELLSRCRSGVGQVKDS